jgi:hypothetical protein
LIAVQVCFEKSGDWRRRKLKQFALFFDECEPVVAETPHYKMGLCSKSLIDGQIIEVKEYRNGPSIIGLTLYSTTG